jgi:hypothetical protein
MPNVRNFIFEMPQLACTPTYPSPFFFPSLLFFPPILSLSPALALSPSPSPSAPHSSPAAPVTLLLRRPPVSRRRPHKLYPPASRIYIKVHIYVLLFDTFERPELCSRWYALCRIPRAERKSLLLGKQILKGGKRLVLQFYV